MPDRDHPAARAAADVLVGLHRNRQPAAVVHDVEDVHPMTPNNASPRAHQDADEPHVQ
jgi:hypothetical protein